MQSRPPPPSISTAIPDFVSPRDPTSAPVTVSAPPSTVATDVVPPPPTRCPPEVQRETPPETPPETGVVPSGGRLLNGRFAKGNPGKPRGARNRTTIEVERLLEEAASGAVQTIVGAAQSADVDAAKWILNRCAPAPRGRTAVIPDFPEIKRPADIILAFSAITTSFADGVISIEEAATATRLLREFLEIFEAANRLAAGEGPAGPTASAIDP